MLSEKKSLLVEWKREFAERKKAGEEKLMIGIQGAERSRRSGGNEGRTRSPTRSEEDCGQQPAPSHGRGVSVPPAPWLERFFRFDKARPECLTVKTVA